MRVGKSDPSTMPAVKVKVEISAEDERQFSLTDKAGKYTNNNKTTAKKARLGALPGPDHNSTIREGRLSSNFVKEARGNSSFNQPGIISPRSTNVRTKQKNIAQKKHTDVNASSCIAAKEAANGKVALASDSLTNTDMMKAPSKSPRDASALFMRLVLWLLKRRLLIPTGLVFHARTISTAFPLLKGLAAVYIETKNALSIVDKVAMLDVINDLMLLADTASSSNRSQRRATLRMHEIFNDLHLDE